VYLKITVIIVTYNRSELLKTTLEALSCQSRQADEVVVVDNNSTDNTKRVAGSFHGRLPVKYVFEKMQGIAIARNSGIENSCGDIIVFTDDDCVPEKDWLKYIEVPFLRDPSIGLVGGKVLPYLKPEMNLVERFSSAFHLLHESPKT